MPPTYRNVVLSRGFKLPFGSPNKLYQNFEWIHDSILPPGHYTKYSSSYNSLRRKHPTISMFKNTKKHNNIRKDFVNYMFNLKNRINIKNNKNRLEKNNENLRKSKRKPRYSSKKGPRYNEYKYLRGGRKN